MIHALFFALINTLGCFHIVAIVNSVAMNLGVKISLQDSVIGASLVVQWLRICLPMQGTRVRALVWEDPTCRGATSPVSHNY